MLNDGSGFVPEERLAGVSPRPKLGHVRRPQLLAAAAEVISERGLDATRLADVAERAGTSAPTVVYYFSSKAELFEQALAFSEESYYEELTTRLEDVDGAAARLVLLVRDWVGGQDADVPLWMELWLRALREPVTRALRERLDRRWRRAIADIVRRGQARGEFSATADPDEVGLALAALLDGLAVQIALGDPDVPPARAVKLGLGFAATELGCELAVTGEAAGVAV